VKAQSFAALGSAAPAWNAVQEETEMPPERPLRLFAQPEPVEVIMAEVPEGPPLRFRWRRVIHEVARSEGPERIAPEWWRPEDMGRATRDYFRVEDREGRRYWLFREGLYGRETERPLWYIHGLFA
jgi:protein ImuB